MKDDVGQRGGCLPMDVAVLELVNAKGKHDGP